MIDKNTTEAILGQLHTRLSVLPAWSTTNGQVNLPRDVVLSNIEAAIEQAKPVGSISDGYHTFDELYAHRVRLFTTLMHAYPKRSWWSLKHHDESVWEGWVIAGIDTPAGTVTYHLPFSELSNLPGSTQLPVGKQWDGHTADDVLERLLSLRADSYTDQRRVDLPKGFHHEYGVINALLGTGDVMVSHIKWPSEAQGIAFSPVPAGKAGIGVNYEADVAGKNSNEIDAVFVVKSTSVQSLELLKESVQMAIDGFNAGHYAPHQLRVISEQAELSIKLNALNAFIDGSPVFAGLEDGEKVRLRAQATHMADYRGVLLERIAGF